MTVVGVL